MKVLMFGWEFPPHNSGGLGTACHGLARALVENNIDISFVLPRTDLNNAPKWLKMISADIKSMRVKGFNTLLSPYITSQEYSHRLLFNRGGPYAEDLLGEVQRYAAYAREVADEEKHDVIHAHEWLAFPASIEARDVSDRPVVMHVHSTEYDRSGGNMNPEVYDLESSCLHKSDKIIAVSDYTRKIMIDKYGIKPSTINTVHNGVYQPGDVDHYYVEENEIVKLKKLGYKIVLYVGRFSLHKGPDYFLKAAKEVLKYKPKTVFVLAGSGEMEHQLIRLVAELGISQNVIFTGFIRGKQLAQLYASADLYVLPSVSEPFGIAPLESLTYGTPVLISKQSGVSEAVRHALKVDFWDKEDMTHKIVSALEHEVLRENLGHNGHKEVQKFNWNSAAKKCINVYDSMKNVVINN